MRAGFLRSIVSSPNSATNSATPRYLAALRPSGIAFARHASTIPIFGQRKAGHVFISEKANRFRWASRRQLNSTISEETTIYALSTAPGTAAIAIIRISGAACVDVQY